MIIHSEVHTDFQEMLDAANFEFTDASGNNKQNYCPLIMGMVTLLGNKPK